MDLTLMLTLTLTLAAGGDVAVVIYIYLSLSFVGDGLGAGAWTLFRGWSARRTMVEEGRRLGGCRRFGYLRMRRLCLFMRKMIWCLGYGGGRMVCVTC